MNPELTFCLPCWNGAFVLNQTLDSIFEQEENNYEVIIINDGSNDKTKEILGIIDDSRFRIINLPERKGAGYARNTGNAIARADIISVIDCGDILYKEKAGEIISYFKGNSVDIMCAATDSLDGTPFIPPRLYKSQKTEKLGFEHPGVSYRKQVPEKIKYRTTSLETDQYDAFFFEAGRAGFKFGVYAKPLSAKLTFSQYSGGRNLKEALLVKAEIYREFGIPLPEWLIKHEAAMTSI